MKSAIIIGASSGIGQALVVTLSTDGYRVGLVARRTDLLAQLGAELPGPCVIKTIDVSQPELAMPLLRELIEELRDVELFIVSAGTGFENAALAWEPERDTIALNVLCSPASSIHEWPEGNDCFGLPHRRRRQGRSLGQSAVGSNVYTLPGVGDSSHGC